MACAAFLYSTGVPVQSFLFPLVFVQMQLVEGLRWSNAVDEAILALAGKLVLYLQPAAALYEGGNMGFIAPYLIVQTIAEVLTGGRDLHFRIAGDGHFRWDWLGTQWPITLAPYWAMLAYSTYQLYPRPVFLGLVALLVYYNMTHWKYGTSGSLWCVAVNLLWIYYLLC
jgi:hypothetical protein